MQHAPCILHQDLEQQGLLNGDVDVAPINPQKHASEVEAHVVNLKPARPKAVGREANLRWRPLVTWTHEIGSLRGSAAGSSTRSETWRKASSDLTPEFVQQGRADELR